MQDLDKFLVLPKPLTDDDQKRLDDLDAVEVLEEWSAEAGRKRIQHSVTIEWNGPRRPYVVHPSSASNPCDRFIYNQMVAGEGEDHTPPDRQRIYDTGTAIHAQMRYYQETRAMYHKYAYLGEVGFNPSNSPNAEKLKMAGHADGLSRRWPLKKSSVVWEYKSINAKGFERLTSPQSDHPLQVHLYMLALGSPVAIIVYINKDTSQFRAFKVPFEEKIWRPAVTRLLRIRENARNMEDPERRISSSCKSCRYRSICEPDLSSFEKGRGRVPQL